MLTKTAEIRADRSTGRSLPLQGRGSGFEGAAAGARAGVPGKSRSVHCRKAERYKYIKPPFISYCYVIEGVQETPSVKEMITESFGLH